MGLEVRDTVKRQRFKVRPTDELVEWTGSVADIDDIHHMLRDYRVEVAQSGPTRIGVFFLKGNAANRLFDEKVQLGEPIVLELGDRLILRLGSVAKLGADVILDGRVPTKRRIIQ